MKKSLLILMTLFLIVGLVACTQTATEAPAEESGGEEAESPETSEEDVEVPDTLTFSTWGDPTFFETGFTSLKESDPKYADVTWEVVPGGEDTNDLLSKFIVDFAAKSWDTVPDLAEMNTTTLGKLVEGDMVVDLTEFLEPYRDQFSASVLEGVTFDGKIYALPWMPNTAMVWYHSEVFEEAGINPDDIETWDDYLEAGRVIRDFEFADGEQHFIHDADIGWGPDMQIQMMLQQQCSGLFDPETGELTIDQDPAFANAMEFWNTGFEEGIFMPIEAWSGQWFSALSEGKIASYISANWMDQVIQFDFENAEGKWRAMPLPAWEEGGVRAAFEGNSANLIVLNKPELKEDLVFDYLEHSFLNAEVTGDLLAGYFLVPAFQPAFDNAYYSEPNEFYGGQLLGDLDKMIQNDSTCSFPYTENYSESLDIIMAELQDMWAGNQTPAEAINNAAETIRLSIQ